MNHHSQLLYVDVGGSVLRSPCSHGNPSTDLPIFSVRGMDGKSPGHLEACCQKGLWDGLYSLSFSGLVQPRPPSPSCCHLFDVPSAAT